jgi:hypothetical protein
MPAFDDYALDAFAETDAIFSEDFVIRPYANPADKRAPAAPDATRDTVSIPGVWFDKPADQHEPNAYDTREWRRPGVSAGAPYVEFSPSAFGAILGFELRDGDRIDRLSSNTAYQVRSTFFTPSGILRAPVSRLGPIT